jgi:hypothetical protein
MACAVRGVDVLTELILILAGTATEEEEAAHHDDLPAQTMGAAVTTARPAVLETTTATQPDQLPVPGNGL